MVLLRAGRSDSGPAITGTPCAVITMNTNEGAKAATADECKSQTNDIITTDAVLQFKLPFDIVTLAKKIWFKIQLLKRNGQPQNWQQRM